MGLLTESGDDRVGEFPGTDADAAGPRLEDVVGMETLLNGAQPGVVHGARYLRPADMPQQHDRRQEESRGIGEVLPGPTGRAAVNRLKHRRLGADIGGAGQADRTGDLRRHVRENVAVKIRHDEHVEGRGRIGQFGRANIDDPVFMFQPRVFQGDGLENLVEQTIGELHDVIFGQAGHLAPAVTAGVFESVTHNTLTTGTRYEL